MKRIIVIITLVSLLFLINACSIQKNKEWADINVKFTIFNLSDEEFLSVGTKELDTATKNDFRRIEFILEVKHPNKVKNRKIIIPNFREVANSYDKDRYWFGQSMEQDNLEEKFAKYENKFVFYSRDLDEQTIKSVFNKSVVKVYLEAETGEIEEKEFTLGEVIEYK